MVIKTADKYRLVPDISKKYTMEQVKQNIEELRRNRYSCSQATLLGIKRGLNASMLDDKTLMAISVGLRGGIGSTHSEGTCGALTGAVVALGLLFPDDAEKVVVLSRELFNGFRNEFGSVICDRIKDENGRKRCTECCVEAGCLAAALYRRETSQEKANI